MFKFILAIVLIGGVLADVSDLLRRPPRQRLQTPYPVQVQVARAPIAILRQEQDAAPDASAYKWGFETENGIIAQAEGVLRQQPGFEPAVISQGGFAYTSPEGIPISLKYVADENGFRAEGAHLPTPPPIPVAIQRALAWIAAHPQPENQN